MVAITKLSMVFALTWTATANAVSALPESGLTGILSDVFNSMFLEFCFLTFFLLGFGLLRLDKFAKMRKRGWSSAPSVFTTKKKIIRGEYQAGNRAAALQIWREVAAGDFTECIPVDIIRMVAHALLDEGGSDASKQLRELASYIARFDDPLKSMGDDVQPNRRMRKNMGPREGITAILNTIIHTCTTRGSMPVYLAYDVLQFSLNASPNEETFEALLCAYATAGDVPRVEETVAKMRENFRVISPRAYVLTVTGFLRSRKVEQAQTYIKEMLEVGCSIPVYFIYEVVKCSPSGSLGELIDYICMVSEKSGATISPEALAQILEDAARSHNVALGDRMCKLAQEKGINFIYPSYDALVKLYAADGNPKAIEYFEEMICAGFRLSEASCVAFIATCAESKFMKLAERVVKYCREKETMSLPIYSSLMKVYAYSRLYDKACDLYADVQKDNIEPDAVMIGCLMNFAARAGRSELSEELFKMSKFPAEVQNYMSQIRSCRQSKDVRRALRLLDEMRGKMIADRTAFNSVLDVCVSARDMHEANTLFEGVRKNDEACDVVAYNTMIKGYCVMQDSQNAMKVFNMIREDGLVPNDVSYNNILNTHIGRRDFSGAWSFYLKMKEAGIAEDSYTISTLTKVLKQCNDQTFIRNVLQMLDQTALEFTSDEVLLSVVLDAFVRLKDTRRLHRLMDKVKHTRHNFSVATNNVLIKSLSMLKRIDDAKSMWHEMTEERGMMPNEISVGCMIDALVSNELPEEAADLALKWGKSIPLNTIIYSTLIKGFAISRNALRALEMYALMKENGVSPNLVTLNTLIDACGRSGRMDKCVELMEEMQSNGDLAPDRITYATLVKGFCLQGEIDQGIAVMESARRRGFAADVIAYNTILDGCVQRDRFGDADKMFERMLADGVKPTNFTLTVLIKRYGREGKVQSGFDVADSLPKKYNFPINTQTATCLIQCCITNKQLNRALKVFEKMKAEGPPPDSHTYERLILGCVRGGDAEKACLLVQDAYGLHGPIGNLGTTSKFPSGAVTPGGNISRVSGLDSGALEKVVDQLTGKGLAESHCIPLVRKLREAGIKVPQRLVATTLCGALNETTRKTNNNNNGSRANAPWRSRQRQ